MDRPIVLVDMDGVLADFEAGVLACLREKHPDTVAPELRHFRVHMNFDDESIRAEILAIITRPGFFRDLPLMNGAREGWQRLIDLGYHPRICSSPLLANPTCEADKREWLTEHFGAEVADDAIITKAKYKQDGIALIDDRTDLHHTDKAPWRQIIFDALYNQDFETNYRLHGWSDPMLPKLLQRAGDER